MAVDHAVDVMLRVNPKVLISAFPFSPFLHLRHPPVEGLGAVRRRKEPGKRSFARGNPPFKGIFYPYTSGGSSTAAGAQLEGRDYP